jgi:benzoyl-CoA 2,3-dioxygenase component B
LLERRSGQKDNPRILGAFNELTPDWLSFFMFTYFTDRDGKMQLAALAESGFDPLSRSCRFMLTEEAHHLFVGETGVGRTIEATCAAMVKAGISDPYDTEAIRKLGVVDLPLLQRKANFHMSVTRDLFGSEISSNGAESFSSGLKGRFNEAKLSDDHQLQDATYKVTSVVDGKLVDADVPALRAINCRLLDDYIADCQGGIDRWNKAIEKAGVKFQMKQPHKGFNRKIGEFAGHRISPDGALLSEADWDAQKGGWLPNESDMQFINSLMNARHAPGEYASWIAPPRMGINQQPVDYEYVRIA